MTNRQVDESEAIKLAEQMELQGKALVASMVLLTLRHVRDNAPKQWDALMSTAYGVHICELWDYLREIERMVDDDE